MSHFVGGHGLTATVDREPLGSEASAVAVAIRQGWHLIIGVASFPCRWPYSGQSIV